MKHYQIRGYGLPGQLDLGVIRYIPALEPLCGFIDSLLDSDDFVVDITDVNLSETDLEELGHLAFHSHINEDYVTRKFETLSGEATKELIGAIKIVADEFRHFRFYSTLDDSLSSDSLGGVEVEQLYAEIYAMHKGIVDGEPNEIPAILSANLLGIVYHHFGEMLKELFEEPLAMFTSRSSGTARHVDLEYVGEELVPALTLTITMEF